MYVTWNTSKTRHNEVAPNQFELAPILKKQTCGRSQLFVDGCNGKVAERHDLKVLFHENHSKA
jgi:glutamine synthetase